MSLFFNRLNYSFGNEDSKTERMALKLKPTDRVLCITASGDRPLNLLVDDCKEIISVDMNPHQNALLRLKIKAMENLDYDNYLHFLGAESDECRKEQFKRILPQFDEDEKIYWKTYENDILKGILYQGHVEKWTKIISFMFKLFRKKKIENLFAFDDLEAQRKFVKNEWDTHAFRKCFEICLNPYVSQLFLNDPGLHKYLDKHLNVGNYIYDRMNKSLEHHLANENPLLSLIFLGKVLPPGFPPYLQSYATKQIRKRLNKVKIITANIVEYLESVPAGYFDAFSISDVASYLNPKDFKRLIHAMQRAAKPDARFCIRQFLSDHTFPPVFNQCFTRDTALEEQLEKDDRCFVYRFVAGEINKES